MEFSQQFRELNLQSMKEFTNLLGTYDHSIWKLWSKFVNLFKGIHWKLFPFCQVKPKDFGIPTFFPFFLFDSFQLKVLKFVSSILDVEEKIENKIGKNQNLTDKNISVSFIYLMQKCRNRVQCSRLHAQIIRFRSKLITKVKVFTHINFALGT